MKILVLSANAKIRSTLAGMLRKFGWTVYQATDQDHALALLKRLPISVIITDGAWQEMLAFALELPKPPSVIVTMPFADEALWAEVLNLGGYDVLAQPFDANEVTRITQAALRRSEAAGLLKAAV